MKWKNVKQCLAVILKIVISAFFQINITSMKLWNQNHQIIFHRLNILSEFNQFVTSNGHCVTKSVGLFLERDAEWAFLECQHRLLKLFDGNLRVLCLCLDTYYVTKTTLHTFERIILFKCKTDLPMFWFHKISFFLQAH